MDMRWIKSWAYENAYKYWDNSNDTNVVIIGESHREEDLMKEQERLIDKLKPEFLLHEYMGVQTYDPETKSKECIEGRMYGDAMPPDEDIPDYLIQWSDQYGFFLVGSDLTMEEVKHVGRCLSKKYPETYDYDPEYDIVERLDGEEFSHQDDGVIPYRDSNIGNMISQYARKTTAPLVAIVGGYHIKDNSSIHTRLEEAGIGYACIDQSRK